MSRKQTINTNKSATVQQKTKSKTVTDYNALFESAKLKRIKEKGMATPPSMPQTRSERAFFESEVAVTMDTKKDTLAVQPGESLLSHLPHAPQPPAAHVATIDRNEKGIQTDVCDDDGDDVEAGPADQTARGDSQIDDEVLQKIVQVFAQIPAFRNTQLQAPPPPSARRQYSTQRSVTPQNPPEPLWFIPKTKSPKEGKSPAKSHRDKASGHAPHTPLPFVVHLNKNKDLSSSSSSSPSPPKRRKVGQTLPKERNKVAKKDKSYEKHKEEKGRSQEKQKDEKGRAPEKQKNERGRSPEKQKNERGRSPEKHKDGKGRPPEKQKDEKGRSPEKQKEEKSRLPEKQKEEKEKSREKQKPEKGKGTDHVKHPQDKDDTHEKHKDEEKRKSTRSKKEQGKTVQPKNEKGKSARDKKKHGSKKK